MVAIRVNMNLLGDFISEQLRTRHMSARQFADYAGINHSTITKAMYKVPPEPSLDFLAKLARATSTDLCVLVALVKPDEARKSPELMLLADRFSQLPDVERDQVSAFVIGLLSQRSHKNS